MVLIPLWDEKLGFASGFVGVLLAGLETHWQLVGVAKETLFMAIAAETT
jgi:hypothetical protein